ncbi:hypothetical protein AVEN_117518-1 [Araneus ventricosus]|uniref:Uncharacterized protein n=1 Tax=Araneus ventricosus TaxID=182803 RepID=A0A4Y2P1G8_ARAVE|nr:hypothetical protein AVEN_117518-1 [Araneus ventricosus]
MSATVRAIIVIISDSLSVLLLICASAVLAVTRASCFLKYSRIMRHYPAFAVHPPYDFCNNTLEDSRRISDLLDSNRNASDKVFNRFEVSLISFCFSMTQEVVP